MTNPTNVEINKDQNLKLAKHQRERNMHLVDGEFSNLSDFKKHAMGAEWNVSQKRIHVAGIPYTLIATNDLQWKEVLARKKPAVVIYSQPGKAWADEGKKVGLAPWIVMVWKLNNNNILAPANVVTTRPQFYTDKIRSMTELNEAAVTQDNLIGNHATVKITSLPNSSELKALVDTGATLCSLHVDRWKVDGRSVSFVNKQLSSSVITLPLVTQMAVKSGDGGTEYRPVIELNIKVNDKLVQGVQFNLNNRAHMDHPVLLGSNFLKQTKMLIDPNMTTESDEHLVEYINWESLNDDLNVILAESDDIISESDGPTSSADLVNIMMKSNVTLSDLVKQIRKLEYAGE